MFTFSKILLNREALITSFYDIVLSVNAIVTLISIVARLIGEVDKSFETQKSFVCF